MNRLIIKKKSATQRWFVWQTGDPTEYMYLDGNFAGQANLAQRLGDDSSVILPTNSVITLGGHDDTNDPNGAEYLCYAFAPIEGYSKMGSYEGNNSSSDNAFVFTGFLPSFLLIKNADSTEDWTIRDIEHSGYYTDRANPIPIGVQPSTSTNATGGSAFNIDFVSNGFKVRGNNADVGASNTYVYLAFASNPFKFNNAR